MAWQLTKNLVKLRADINARFPLRDKASDGAVGDLDHQDSVSGHNPDRTGNAEYKDGDLKDEVRAIDVDKDLRDPHGVGMQSVVWHLVEMGREAHARGSYFPLRYIIFNGRIWSSTDGWRTRTYSGANKHTQHAHFSGARSQRADEDDTFDYGLSDLGIPQEPSMAFDAEEQKFIKDQAKLTPFADGGGSGSPIGNGVWGHGFPRRPGADRDAAWTNVQAIQIDVDEMKTTLASLTSQLVAVQNTLRDINAKLDQ